MEERHLFAVWCMDAHAVGLDAAPAPAAPDVAVGIAADAVREPRPEVGELLAAAHAGPGVHHVEHHDIGGELRPVWRAGIHDGESLGVGRGADTLRALPRLAHDLRRAP